LYSKHQEEYEEKPPFTDSRLSWAGYFPESCQIILLLILTSVCRVDQGQPRCFTFSLFLCPGRPVCGLWHGRRYFRNGYGTCIDSWDSHSLKPRADNTLPATVPVVYNILGCPVVIITCVQYLGPPGPFSFPDSRDLLEVLGRTFLGGERGGGSLGDPPRP